MSREPFLPRHNRVSIPIMSAGAGEVSWVMTEDIDGNKLPKRIKIVGIAIKASVSTIKALRIYSKSTRVNDAGDSDYSLVYEDTWTTSTLASTNHESVIPNKVYIDDDSNDETAGTIWGSIQIKGGEAASAFMIDIDFMQN